MTVVEKIIQLLQTKDISQKEFAESLHIQKNAITDWKSGRLKSYRKMLPEIAAVLGVSVDELLDGTKENAGRNSNAKIKSVIAVPVYGYIRCGIPEQAIEDIIDTEELNPDQFEPGNYIGLVARGNSMYPDILSGDVMIIRAQDYVNDGELAIVYVNGDEATCKRIKKEKDGITLIPSNKAFDETHFSREQIANLPVRILGKVCEIRRKVK